MGGVGCSSDDGGDDPPDSRETLCSIGVQALALGLQQYQRTEVIGDLLDGASDATSVVCRNAVANLQAGRSMRFELLRPTADPIDLAVDLSTLTAQPPPVPPPGSSLEIQQLWSTCWKDYSASNWMLDLCLREVISPISAG